jgi:hypothetical protein
MTNRPSNPGSNPPGGLLARVNKPPQAPSPFSPSPAPNPRLASTATKPRFGANALTWEILPFGETLVCFSLEGLGGSLKYLMGDDAPAAGGNYEAVLQTLENDAQKIDKLKHTLDEVWSEYHLMGAILVYPWKPTTREVIAASAKVKNARPVFLRAFDPLLVMNVLARSRENLLQPRAPLSFDKAYLERALISDDPRLLRLVQISGYFEEVVQAANPPEEEEGEDG